MSTGKQGWFGALSLVLAICASAQAASDPKQAILKLMDAAFEAVASGDPDDWAAIQLANGTSISLRQDPANPGQFVQKMMSNEAMVAEAIADENEYLERWLGEPEIRVHGPTAVVWGAYEFWINGERSHCGIDSVQLIRVDDDWKIANWTWTVEPDACPPAAAD